MTGPFGWGAIRCANCWGVSAEPKLQAGDSGVRVQFAERIAIRAANCQGLVPNGAAIWYKPILRNNLRHDPAPGAHVLFAALHDLPAQGNVYPPAPVAGQCATHIAWGVCAKHKLQAQNAKRFGQGSGSSTPTREADSGPWAGSRRSRKRPAPR
jgi:hypothetical protein